MARPKSTNQQRGRKSGGSSSFTDGSEPSKAPGQDEQGEERVGNTQTHRHQIDTASDEQGISNRPLKDEHAFPNPGTDDLEGDDSVEVTPKQQGGRRGAV